MYKCNNCRGEFDTPTVGYEPYPDHGGEYFKCCPICGMADVFEEINEEDEEDD